MSITKDFDTIFLVCNGYLVIRVGQLWQATLRTGMKTSIHMILDLDIFLQDDKRDYKKL